MSFPDPQPIYDADAIRLQFRILQGQLSNWVLHNFGDRPSWQPLLGCMEELGELTHSHLKEVQGIRMSEDHVAKAKDAIADITIFLLDYCCSRGWQFGDILTDVLPKVLARDWRSPTEDPK